jgi:hypothetical protein
LGEDIEIYPFVEERLSFAVAVFFFLVVALYGVQVIILEILQVGLTEIHALRAYIRLYLLNLGRIIAKLRHLVEGGQRFLVLLAVLAGALGQVEADCQCGL